MRVWINTGSAGCDHQAWRTDKGYTSRADPCCTVGYVDRALRVNVTLDPEHDAKLTRLAERTHLEKGTLARSLLLQAIDEADTEPRNVVALLDGIPGAWERAMENLASARRGETIALDQL